MPLPSASADGASTVFTGVRVLVADDDPVNRMLVAAMLKKLGCQVDLAVDGLEAVNRHAGLACDLVLMDCQMPGLDGYQATARIRELDGARRHTPVIALTASDETPERERCAAAGMDDFLAKPLAAPSLRDVLYRWLRRSPVLDAGKLATMHAMFGEEEVAALIDLYCEDAPRRIKALQQALAVNDAAEMARIAHAFGGSCASIGAAALCEMCKELEARLKECTDIPDGIRQRLEAVESEYARVRTQLQKRQSDGHA